MRLVKRTLVVVGSMGVLLLGVAAPASAANNEVCVVQPTNFRPQGMTYDETIEIQVLFVKGTSMLDCPDGHPLDGSRIDIAQQARLKFDRDNPCVDGSTSDGPVGQVRGFSRTEVRTIYEYIIDFKGRVAGTIQPGDSGTCVLDLNVRARGSNGSELFLHEIGVFSVSTELLELSIVSGETTISDLYGHGTGPT